MTDLLEDQRVDLNHFDAFNEQNPRGGPNARESAATWERRKGLIHETFESTRAGDAHDPSHWVMRADAGLIFTIFQDIHIVGQNAAKGGRRPEADPAQAAEDQRQMTNSSYSELPFHDAFRVLIRARRDSITAATRRIQRSDPKHVGLSRSRVYRLMIADGNPTEHEMALIAVAYGKPLEYFNEYRVAKICEALALQLNGSPETSMHLYRKLTR